MPALLLFVPALLLFVPAFPYAIALMDGVFALTFALFLCYSGSMRFYPTLLALAVLAAAHPALAAAKHHHPAAQSRLAEAQAQHRIRLAAKEKKSWREHLAKLRSLPHAERVAEKHHEKLWQRKHDAKVAQMQAASEQAKRERLHQEKLAERAARRHHARPNAAVIAEAAAAPLHTAGRGAAHARYLAALKAAHEENRARHEAAVTAAVRHEKTVHLAAQAKHLAALSQHLAALSRHAQNVLRHAQIAREWAARRQALHALHQAKLAAAGRARWAALHGGGSGSKSIRFWQTGAAGVPLKVISVDLNDPNVKVSAVMAARGNGTSEPFHQMISRTHPNVAVTGTFFSLDDLQPVGDIVIDGSLVHFGGMGTALCITPSNEATMVTCQWGRHHDWSPFDFVVACGPRLLHRGRVVLNPRAERFRDKHMLAPNSRIAVGITRGNTLFFVMTHDPISLGRLARVMQALGAADAMNLDAGTSTGFYYNGATLARPGRKLTNMIVVYGRRERYERELNQLVPAAYHRSAASRRLPLAAHFAAHSRTASLVRP